jgi:arsenate reductase (thioredoxin)
VLFVCVHNAGRSRMAEAIFNREAPDGLHAGSAGTQPAARPHPEVIEAMREIGIELPSTPGALLTPDLADDAGRLVSMGCSIEEACPATRTPMEDWALDDPKGRPIEEVRRIRDDIAERVRALISELG